jgi:hypothetical protein
VTRPTIAELATTLQAQHGELQRTAALLRALMDESAHYADRGVFADAGRACDAVLQHAQRIGLQLASLRPLVDAVAQQVEAA